MDAVTIIPPRSKTAPQEAQFKTFKTSTQPIRFTVVTSTNPDRLAKQYRLGKDGLRKKPAGQMIKGNARVHEVCDFYEFARVLSSLKRNQALVFGLPPDDEVELVTEKAWRELGCPEGPYPRIQESFNWPNGPAVMFGDYDPEDGAAVLSPEGFLAILVTVITDLAYAGHVWWASASSYLTNRETSEDLTGQRGQRFYWLVEDGTDISRAGETLQTYLWAAGHGYIKISKSGALLERTLLDASVWQTNRFDFAAGADCVGKLYQNRGEPVVFPGSLLDTRTAIPEPPTEIQAQAERAKQAAKDAAKPEAAARRAAYIKEKATEMAEMAGDAPSDEAALAEHKNAVCRALDGRILTGNFPLYVVKDGDVVKTTVQDALTDPRRYDGLLTLDPIEPDYDGERVVGKLYLSGSRPCLFSFARGGLTFMLSRTAVRIEVVRGKTADVVEHVLHAMREAPDVYDMGGLLVVVRDGRVWPQDKYSLRHWLGSAIQFWHWKPTPKGGSVEALMDPPAQVAEMLLSPGTLRKLKPLEGVITAPTIRQDGTILSRLGYDEQTGLLLEMNADDVLSVPDAPTEDDVAKAMQVVALPFKDFPVVGPQDRGILLAALLTATVRAVLPTAPAFGFDAPVQGSGKTLLATCIGVLATGVVPTVWPHTHGRDDEEIRKRLMAILSTGTRVVVWDNVTGTFDSAALAAALTSSRYTDRVLGRSASIEVPNRALWLLTGNNLSLAGDMPRRVLRCRIDPAIERPYAREFDIQPEAYCNAHRQRMVNAALTLIRARRMSNDPPALGRMASFETWDDLVRQTVAWLARRYPDYADPMDVVDSTQATDPEQERLDVLLEALLVLFGDEPFTTKQIAQGYQLWLRHDLVDAIDDDVREMCEALDEFRTSKPLTPRSIGKVLGNRADRIVKGRCLTRTDSGGRVATWRVVFNH